MGEQIPFIKWNANYKNNDLQVRTKSWINLKNSIEHMQYNSIYVVFKTR